MVDRLGGLLGDRWVPSGGSPRQRRLPAYAGYIGCYRLYHPHVHTSSSEPWRRASVPGQVASNHQEQASHRQVKYPLSSQTTPGGGNNEAGHRTEQNQPPPGEERLKERKGRRGKKERREQNGTEQNRAVSNSPRGKKEGKEEEIRKEDRREQ